MSERMTGIQGPHGGLEEYGRRTRAEMVAAYRRYYEVERQHAEAALATPDDELIVETYLGSLARRDCQPVTA